MTNYKKTKCKFVFVCVLCNVVAINKLVLMPKSELSMFFNKSYGKLTLKQQGFDLKILASLSHQYYIFMINYLLETIEFLFII